MADVGLLLEGTYPYITGGVSTWVHDIITNLPEISFDIISIVPSRNYAKEFKYKLPPNVASVKNLYLNEVDNSMKNRLGFFSRRAFFKKLSAHVAEIRNGNYSSLLSLAELFREYKPLAGDLLNTRQGWNFSLELYNSFEKDFSFIDFFWTMRFIIIPLAAIVNFDAPACGCYHTVSTGYAGLLGSVFKALTGKEYILTEHGIYTNERLLEIVDAGWIYENKGDASDLTREVSPLKKLWIDLFIMIGKITYHYANRIITLFKENRQLQIKFGAAPEKCSVIPNGIDVEKFKYKRENVSSGPEYKVGFVGRVVPIKDVKTLIHAARFVADNLKGVKFLIKGPVDEDKNYFEECKILVNLLGLNKNVFFQGPSDVMEFYKDLDLLVLSSVSEAQPLALLEANVSSVPVVSTDVGAVRELLYGGEEEDIKLGASGVVVPVKMPQIMGREIVNALLDIEANKRMGASGVERVMRYYRKEELINKYREIYESSIK